MVKPFIVMCAPNGARKTKADHAALPISATELADCAEAILQAGASVIHLHIRDDEGRHSLDVDRYRLATDAIRDRVGDELVIQVTTEACGIYEAREQMAMVKNLRPEAVSLALKELCRSETDEAAARDFFAWLKAERIMGQYILYTPEEVLRFVRLRDKGVIPDRRPFVLLVLGRYSEDLTGDPGELEYFTAALDNDIEWGVCCFGRTEQEAAIFAAAHNGHARVGFENNFLLPDGASAKDNAALVRLAATCQDERPIATAADVRNQFS